MPIIALKASAASSAYGFLGTTQPTATGYFATAVKPALGSGGTGEGLTLPYTVSDSSGNIYTAGKTSYNSYAYIQKTSPTGQVLFLKHITNSTGNTFIELTSIGYVFVITGDASSSTGYIFIKFDYNGNVILSRRISQLAGSMILSGTYFDPATQYLYVAHSVNNGGYIAGWSVINTQNGTLPYSTINTIKFNTTDTYTTSIVVQNDTLVRYFGVYSGANNYIVKQANASFSFAVETGYVRSLALGSNQSTLYAGLTYFSNSSPFGVSKYSSFPTSDFRVKVNSGIFSATTNGTFNKLQLDSSNNIYIFGWADASTYPTAGLFKFSNTNGSILSSYSITGTTTTGAISSITSSGGMKFSQDDNKLYLAYSASTGDNSGYSSITMSLKLSGTQTGSYTFPFADGTMTTTFQTTSATVTSGGSATGGSYSVGTLDYSIATFTPTISNITNYDSKSVIIPA